MISIVTATLNAAHALERNLSAMALQRADFEHIIQDGGSTDGTRDLVERYRSRYHLQFYQEPDSGIYDAVTQGMSKANGDILGWVGADDFYMPWTLATVQSIFDSMPNVHWITGIPAWYDERNVVGTTGTIAPTWPRWAIRHGLASTRLFGFPQTESMFWRRWLWEKAEPRKLLPCYRYAGDYHLWRRFAQYAPLRTVNSVLACFTISEDQASSKFKAVYLDECGLARGPFHPSCPKRMVRHVLNFLLSPLVIRANTHIR